MYLLPCVMKEVTNLLRLNCEVATVSSLSVDMDPCVSGSPLYICLKSDISKITRGLTRCYTKNKPVSFWTHNHKLKTDFSQIFSITL